MTDSLDALKKQVCDTVEALRPRLLGICAEIHAHPELRFEEHKASRLLARTLAAEGLDVTAPAYDLDTAFVTEFGPASEGPCVGIVAEYDALPGIGHACGHDVIATAALGAALSLSKLGLKLPGRVRLLGTPAEEGGGGKELMARKGAFEGIDCAMMVHPSSEDLPTYPLLARSAVIAEYKGRAAHAATEPEAGINALDALVIAYQAVGALRQHIPAGQRVHAIITDGGKAVNVIPDRAAGVFVARARDRAGLKSLRGKLEGCLRAGALATGAEVTLHWDDVDYLDLVTNWALAGRYQANAETLGRRFMRMEDLPAGRAASTDMGNVSYRVPTIHPMIAAVPPGIAFHSIEFEKWVATEIGQKAAIDGAKALAMTALDFLADAALRSQVRAEFDRSMAERAE